MVCCSWDGQTYIVNHNRAVVRYQFQESVAAFTAGTGATTVTRHRSQRHLMTYKRTVQKLFDKFLDSVIVKCCMNRRHSCYYTPIFFFNTVHVRVLYVDKGQKF